MTEEVKTEAEKGQEQMDAANLFREETIDLLHDNYGYVENSILTDSQRQKVKDKVAF